MTNKRTNNRSKIKRDYFKWLCDLVEIEPSRPDHDCPELMVMLHTTIFRSLVPNDDNRAKDGLRLRNEFAETFTDDECYCEACDCLDDPCSVLEMLIALAVRFEFNMTEPGVRDRTPDWFWLMIRNLRLEEYSRNDPYSIEKGNANTQTLQRFVERTYEATGKGGIFPLRRPLRDQTRTELWYQMMSYLQENYPI